MDFEFSQNFLLFWDTLEKANHWLESVLATANLDIDDRTVAHLLATPAEDGGQWNMFVALVRKHGLVLREAKTAVLAVVHRVLAIHLGTPPERVFWQWQDKDRDFHREGWLTPHAFADRYASLPLEDYVCLVHDPRPGSQLGRTYTVDHLGNVVDAPPVVYLNVDMDLIQKLTMDSLVDGRPVWFGCDTAPMSHGGMGLWDAGLYDYDAVYDVETTMTKADRLLHHATLMTHAMLFTGVDVVEGVPRRWRVENSWGETRGDKGFWTMNDNWFGEHLFEVAVHRDRLPPALMAALDQEPVRLPAWDPMGALAARG